MSQLAIFMTSGNLPPDVPLQFDADSGNAIPIANILNILGDVVPAGTTPFRTVGSGNTVTAEIQIAQAIASTNATNIGLAAFNSAHFSVDANGFVSSSATTPLSFPTDTLTAIPSSNLLRLRGQSGVYAGVGGIQVTSPGNNNSDFRMISPYSIADFNFENNTAATKRVVAVQNNVADASSDAVIRATVVGASTSDPYLQVVRGATMCYCWGIDTSDSNTLKICADANSNSAVPSGGTLLYKMTSTGNASYVSGNLDITRSNGSDVTMSIVNGAALTGKALQLLQVESTNASDPQTTYTVNGGSSWSVGVDNSNNDVFSISFGSTLGTNEFFQISTNGDATFSTLRNGTSAPTIFQNPFNTAGSGTNLQIKVAGATADDPYLRYEVEGVSVWSTGLDNSDDDSYKISWGAATLGTNDAIRIAPDLTMGLLAGQRVAVTTPGAYPYTTLVTDYVILVDTSSARTINLLASPETGRTYRIKDNVGLAATNNITITGNIDGAASATIKLNYGSMDVVYNGTEWSIL